MVEGKARIGERVNMQLHLRFILLQPFTEFNDVVKLEKLISKGKLFGGSVLLMDVVLAEKYLSKLIVFLRHIAIAQRVCRGFICREKLLRERNLRDAHKNYLRKVKWQSNALARVLVAEVMEFCVHSNSTEMMKPTLRIAAHMSDIYVVASVHLKARGARKHIGQLCPLCTYTNKKQSRATEITADFEIMATTPPLVCTCRMVMADEQWVVRAYDPLSGATHTRDLNISEVQQIVIDINAVHAFLDPLYKLEKLFALNGSLYCDPLGPLFDSSKADPYCINGDLLPSPSLAVINSSKESSVLFSLPPILSDKLLSLVKSTDNCFRDIDSLEGLRNRGSQGPLVVNNILDLSTIATPEKTWEPLTDYYEAVRLSSWAAYYMQAIETSYSNSILALKNCKILVLKLRESVQWANMTVEDCLANLLRTKLLLAEATVKVQRAMQLSHDNLEEVTMQERGLKENRKNAWSSLEDGNEWIGLNHRRKYLRVLNIHEKEYHFSLVNFTEETKKLRDAIALVLRIRDDVAKNKQWVETFRPNVNLAKVVSSNIKSLTDELVAAVMKTFSLPYKRIMRVGSSSSNVVTGRRLQRVPFNAVFARDQYVRTRHAYRAAWKSFGSLPLAPRSSNLLSYPCISDVAHCVVEVFYDPLTGNYLLSVSEDCLLEEAVQHKDLMLPYKNFTNVVPSYPHELLLNKGDMDTLFAKTPEWPNYLQLEQSVPQTKSNRRAQKIDTILNIPETVSDDRLESLDSPQKYSQEKRISQPSHLDKPVSSRSKNRRQNIPLSPNPSPSHSLSPERVLGDRSQCRQNVLSPNTSPSHSLSRERVSDNGISQHTSSDSLDVPLSQDMNLSPHESHKKRLKVSTSFSLTSVNQIIMNQTLPRSSTAPIPYPSPSPGRRYFRYYILLHILCMK